MVVGITIVDRSIYFYGPETEQQTNDIEGFMARRQTL